MTRQSIEKLKDILERKVQLVKDYRHTDQYYRASMDYHFFLGSTEALKPVMQEVINEDKIAPIYFEQLFNDIVLHAALNQFDVNKPIQTTYPLFYTHEMDEKYQLLRKFVELLQQDYEEFKKHPEQLKLNLNVPVVKAKRDDEFFHVQKLHNDIMEKLNEMLEVEEPAINPNEAIEQSHSLDFDPDKAVLFVNTSRPVKLTKFSNQYHCLRIMFENPDQLSKEWFYSEIAEKFDQFRKSNDKIFHNYFSQIKIKVALQAGVDDLFITTKQSVKINPKYLT